MKLLCVAFLLAMSVVLSLAQHHPLSDKFIRSINDKTTTWRAGRNFNRHTSMRHIKRLMGVLPGSEYFLPPKHHHEEHLLKDLPNEFDSRTAWPNCPTIREIRDQGCCGSCWAFGAVEVMTDRTCIHSGGKVNFHYSAEDLMSCCSSCGFGCFGGFPGSAFSYWVSHGIVSGGSFNSSEGCQPYEIPPSGHGISRGKLPCGPSHRTPACVRKCEDGYPSEYDKDLRKGKLSYGLYRDTKQIMYDIKTNGPLEGLFLVYEDFLHYKTGVYERIQGSLLGAHAIRVLGWGEENGRKYWLCANSWNSDWGDNGYFKILRGSNHCGIEGEMVGGIPADL